MSFPPTTATPPSEGYSNPPSEIDSFSDSEWLDIASGTQSDTDESLDHVDSSASAPLSRRSSFSNSSSRDGEVDAWEGFVDGGVEGAPFPRHIIPSAVADDLNEASAKHASILSDPTSPVHDAEDRRVMVGLEQSLISTLGASRSSTVHNSLRDLRLSFPDPLSSSGEELHIYEEEPSTPAEEIEGKHSNGDVTVTDDQIVLTETNKMINDPGLYPTSEVVHPEKATACYPHATADLVLYGSPASLRWSFVHELLAKVAEGGKRGLNISPRINEIEQVVFVRKSAEPAFHCPQFANAVVVHDRTEDSSMPSSELSPSRPSLAIVFLPCNPALVPAHHTSYLPVLDSNHDLHEATSALQVKTALEQMSLPESRVIQIHHHPLLITQVKDLDASRVYQTLRPFIEKSSKRAATHTITILTIVSLIIGLVVTSAVRNVSGFSASVVSQTTPVKVSAPDSTPNTTALAVRITSDLFVVPPSLSLGVSSPRKHASTLPDSSSSTSIISCTGTKSVVKVPNTIKALAEKVKSSTDVITRSSATLPLEHASAEQPVASTSSSSYQEQETALTVRLVDSLSEIVEVAVKALVEVVQHDIADLMLALDDLMAAIHRVAEQSKNAIQVVREHFQYRNARAKGKARELKEKGMRLASSAGNAFIGRTRTAKKRARSLKDGVVSSNLWAQYNKAQGQWTEALGRKQRSRRGRCRSGSNGVCR